MNIQQLLEQRNKDFDEKITSPYPEGIYTKWGICPSQLLAIKSHIAETNRLLIEKVVEMVKAVKYTSGKEYGISDRHPLKSIDTFSYNEALDDIINELTKQQ